MVVFKDLPAQHHLEPRGREQPADVLEGAWSTRITCLTNDHSKSFPGDGNKIPPEISFASGNYFLQDENGKFFLNFRFCVLA